MYPPRSRDGVDAIISAQDRRRRFPFLCCPFRRADYLFLLLPVLFSSSSSKTSLERLRSPGAELIPASDYVGSVCVVGRIERGEEREHLRRVPAAAEDDEEVRPCPAFAGRGTGAVEGGEDVDESELAGFGQLGEGGGVLSEGLRGLRMRWLGG